MDTFVSLPAEERQTYFQQAAERHGRITAQLMEKDFWVCWILRRLFSLDEFGRHLTLKGGTSLSKVYNVIQRFSEDVDVAIERSWLGFGGNNDPMNAPSGKEAQRRLDRLKLACDEAISQRLEPQLRSSISTALGGSSGWTIERDIESQQTLVFTYPVAITENLSPYFSATVKIELGARSDHFPVISAVVSPYLKDVIEGVLADPWASVRVLAAERTFWEKATILHMIHHNPSNKQLAARMSRHYYDVYQLSNSDLFDVAIEQIDLLSEVAEHKKVYFKSAAAKYDEACRGTLRLVPTEVQARELMQDYQAMQPMFFEEPPDFTDILLRLSDIEDQINRLS